MHSSVLHSPTDPAPRVSRPSIGSSIAASGICNKCPDYNMNGFLPVWKEADFTSHDVVAKLRGILHQKHIGHAGTLDPQATGVLCVGLGNATKAFELLDDREKEYEAEILFGTATDTEDIWGTVTQTASVCLSPAAIEEAIHAFNGTYLQTPPMYSAKKVGGKKLYDLAREGKIIERKPVPVTILDTEVLSINENRAVFRVVCSEGTYIRTLCTDIGKALGVPACMSALTRLRACGFTKEQALTLSQIEERRDNGTLCHVVSATDAALSCYESVTFAASWSKALLNGNVVPAPPLKDSPGSLYRVYLENTGFIGIFSHDRTKNLLKPRKMFLPERQAD